MEKRTKSKSTLWKWVRRIILLVSIVLIVFFGYLATLTPQENRVWTDDLARIASGTFAQDGTVHLKNVRDWTYGIGEIQSREWLPEVVLNPRNIVRTWFVLEPFATWEAIGHTYLTFEFADGTAYSFSVEARKESDETYSAFKGLFRAYELAYTWGTERDFLTRRILYLVHPVRMYPLEIDEEASQALFTTLVKKTNDIAEHPRFYNTLTASCTNVLAEFANESAPGSVPYDLTWNFPGHSDEFLMRIGFIVPSGTVEETKTLADLTPHREEVAEHAVDDYALFGSFIRALVSAQGE